MLRMDIATQRAVHSVLHVHRKAAVHQIQIRTIVYLDMILVVLQLVLPEHGVGGRV